MSKSVDTTNVLRLELLPAELEKLRKALKTLRPKPVPRDELSKVLSADLRMLVRHGVSFEKINLTLAAHAAHITQSFYDTLGSSTRRRRAKAEKSNTVPEVDCPASEDPPDASAVAAEEPNESALPSLPANDVSSGASGAASSTNVPAEYVVPDLQPLQDATPADDGGGMRSVDWTAVLRR